ncbi:alpha/beta fold hydrolase [Spongisporangium articulatum]|uniref:Alpha/beta fold hydrolase n=1 Tax=Spongisporangium articulatum TaxID=3362603 RepID=A0ABW8ARU9_9ACTN
MVAATQEIRFVRVDGGRVAVASVGEGPPLVLPPPWMSHVGHEWDFPEYRAFLTRLAGHHRVVRYDRLGVGLSDPGPDRSRGAHADAGLEAARLEQVLDALGLERVPLFGISWGGCVAVTFAARRPERVSALVTSGTLVAGTEVAPEPLRAAVVDLVRAHWGAGSRLLADIWIPGADDDVRDRFARAQRASGSAAVAADSLHDVYATDIRALLPHVAAPTLVTHRRDDRATPFAAGRELAAGVAGARFVPLDGDIHLPWLGDSAAVLAVVLPFLHEHSDRPGAPADPVLTGREREVLMLVAEGLADAEIAVRLHLSPHTVHRHLANIRTKLGQPSRAAAVAHAGRLGLI